jgi:hypothetical protein
MGSIGRFHASRTRALIVTSPVMLSAASLVILSAAKDLL